MKGLSQMPGKVPQPWFRESKQAWYVCIDGRQRRLSKDRDEAFRRYHLLMAGESPTPSPEPPKAKAGATPSPGAPARQEAITAKETPTVNAIADAYLADAQRRMKANTFRVVRDFCRSFAMMFGERPGDSIRKADVEAWVGKHPTWGQTTEWDAKTRLVTFFRWCVEQGLLPVNPIQGIRKPHVRSRGQDALATPEEHVLMMANATPALRDVLFALHESGARPGEVLSVTAADFHAEQNVWILAKHKTAGKTGKPRIIFLTPPLVTLCRTLVERYPTGALFRTSTGKPWCHGCYLAEQVRKLRKRLGIKGVVPYGYRHGFATDALANGVPDAHVAELLGHSGTAMLHRHYAHLTAKAKVLREALGKVR
jgi:integrase